MLFKMTELKYQPNPVLARALDVLFILHADHEQNCSTTAMRSIGSSHVDPYSSLAGAAAALYGPLHGGANEAVLRMLAEIVRRGLDLAQIHGADGAVLNRQLVGLARSVVDDGQRVRHKKVKGKRKKAKGKRGTLLLPFAF